jgi:hypothetical protein
VPPQLHFSESGKNDVSIMWTACYIFLSPVKLCLYYVPPCYIFLNPVNMMFLLCAPVTFFFGIHQWLKVYFLTL